MTHLAAPRVPVFCPYHILTSNWKLSQQLSQRIGRKESVVYQATVSTEDHNPPQIYVGLTENCFKTRYSNHKFSFSNVSKRHNTELSKYIWYLVKGNFTKFQVTWKILKHAASYNPTMSLREVFYNLQAWFKPGFHIVVSVVSVVSVVRKKFIGPIEFILSRTTSCICRFCCIEQLYGRFPYSCICPINFFRTKDTTDTTDTTIWKPGFSLFKQTERINLIM